MAAGVKADRPADRPAGRPPEGDVTGSGGSAGGGSPSYLEGLNDRQREAVLHEGSPLLILAGAGSGKTRVITVKIAHLIAERGVDPHSILAVTFTNKAAAEMRQRAAALADGASNAMIRTFHSFGAWFLRRNGSAVDLPSGFSIYDDDDSITLLRTIFPDENRPYLAQMARWISRAKDYLLGSDDDLSPISGDPDLATVYRAYEKRLREIGNVDFGDLIALPTRVLRENPEIRDRIRSRFRVIMVDEYQDSNVSQYLLLRELADDTSYVCVVGDDDQSIYRFRGAEVRNILTFPESFPKTHIIRLEQNYRSTSAILSFASAVVANNDGRLGKTLWTSREGGELPRLAYLHDQEQEVRFCASQLSPDNYGRSAILYRTNAQSRPFETFFLRENIPYRLVGTLRFYEREEVKDALAYLRTLANPRDEVSFRRIINKPPRGLGDSSVGKMLGRRFGTGGDLIAAARAAEADLGSRQTKGLRAFLALFERITEALGSMSLPEFVGEVIEQSGIGTYYLDRDEVAGRQRLENLEELMNAAALYGAGPDGLLEFLEGIELDSARAAEDDDGEGNRVTLITMHNTKGLEFDRVFITGLEDGLFPRGAEESAAELEEERRLFYVAITRAKDELYLTCCATRMLHGRTVELSPSRFLGEVPAELIRVDGNGIRRALGFDSGEDYDWGEEGDAYSTAYRDVDDSFEDATFPVGTHVYHDDYGPGVVVKCSRVGRDVSVTVRFESGRTAKFIPRYAPLERIAVDD